MAFGAINHFLPFYVKHNQLNSAQSGNRLYQTLDYNACEDHAGDGRNKRHAARSLTFGGSFRLRGNKRFFLAVHHFKRGYAALFQFAPHDLGKVQPVAPILHALGISDCCTNGLILSLLTGW